MESDNRNRQESESDDGTSDSTDLLCSTPTVEGINTVQDISKMREELGHMATRY